MVPAPQPPAAPAGSASRPAQAWAAALVFAVALAAFQPALLNTFAHDDIAQVAEWPLPASAGEWLRAPLQPWWPPDRLKYEWRPLTRLTILAQKAAPGGAAWPFYGVNLLLHGAASVLLLWAARGFGLSPRASLAAGLLFAAHPIHAEAVHQVVGRAESLAAAWMLLGLGLYARRPGSARALWQQPLCYALALASKDHAILYPAYLALAMLACRPRPADPAPPPARPSPIPRTALLLFLALALVGGGYLALRARVTGGLAAPPGRIPFHENPLAGQSLEERLPAVLGVFGYAASRLLWPLGLSPDYSAHSLPIGQGERWGWTWAGVALLLALANLILHGRRRRPGSRGWLLALGGLLAWALTSNLLFPIGVLTAERLWYWPSAAACVGLGWALARLAGRGEARAPRAFAYALGAATLLLLAASWHYAAAWRGPAAYAEWTVRRFPGSWRGHVNLAREAYQARDFATGLADARRATELLPAMAMGWVWVGLNGTFIPEARAEAEAALRRALALDPGLAMVHRNLANLYQLQGRNAEAAAELRAYLATPHAADRPAVQSRLETLEAGGP